MTEDDYNGCAERASSCRRSADTVPRPTSPSSTQVTANVRSPCAGRGQIHHSVVFTRASPEPLSIEMPRSGVQTDALAASSPTPSPLTVSRTFAMRLPTGQRFPKLKSDGAGEPGRTMIFAVKLQPERKTLNHPRTSSACSPTTTTRGSETPGTYGGGRSGLWSGEADSGSMSAVPPRPRDGTSSAYWPHPPRRSRGDLTSWARTRSPS